VDSFFSVISRYFKFTLKRVHTVEAFEIALFSCFKQAPVCVEQLKFCFDYSGLVQFVDAKLARCFLIINLMICTLFLFYVACLIINLCISWAQRAFFCKVKEAKKLRIAVL
jgi:hypothetical protein